MDVGQYIVIMYILAMIPETGRTMTQNMTSGHWAERR